MRLDACTYRITHAYKLPYNRNTNSQYNSHFLITLKLFVWSKQSQAGNKMFTVTISNQHQLQISRAAIETLHLNKCMNFFKARVGISRKIMYCVNIDGFISSPLDPLNVIKYSQLKSTRNIHFAVISTNQCTHTHTHTYIYITTVSLHIIYTPTCFDIFMSSSGSFKLLSKEQM